MRFLSGVFERFCGGMMQAKRNRQAAESARFGDFQRTLELLDQGADVNAISKVVVCYGSELIVDEYWNVGAAALKHGNNKALGNFLDKGLNPNLVGGFEDAREHSLLTLAILNENAKAAELLIARGADVTFTLPNKKSPLDMAREYKMPSIEALIQTRLEEIKSEAVAPAAFVLRKSLKVNSKMALCKPSSAERALFQLP